MTEQEIQQAYPIGSLVRAFSNGEMWAGTVTSHTPEEGFLTILFTDGHSERFAYIEITDDESESMVIPEP